jgi:DNA ligase (NAD+)
VYIDGVNITSVSLHNFNDILEKDIRVGDDVVIERAGDVIPYIGKVLARSKDLEKFCIPNKCPCCQSEIVQKNALYYCLNVNCRDQVILRILHFANGMDIVGLGRKNVEFFFDNGFIHDISDIFSLKDYTQEIELKNNWGAVSIDKLLLEIEKAKNSRFDRFLYSIGLPGIGDFNAKSFARYFQNFQNFLSYFATSDGEESDTEENDGKEKFTNACKNIRGIGDTICNEVYDYVIQNIDELRKLEQIMTLSYDQSTSNLANDSTLKLFEKSIVITGKFDEHSRVEIKKLIEDNGGIVKSEVNKNTFAVVAGNKPTERKIQQAMSSNVQIISVSELMKIVDD